jgi:CHAT domain-containing protein/tetratricopeptide (TPR) repeat protein
MAMRRLTILCLVACLIVGAVGAEPPEPKPAPLTKEQQEKLKERDRLQKEAERLRAEAKLPEAIAAAEKMLAIERQVFGAVHEELVGSLQFLAELHEAREDFAAARKARQEVLAIQMKLLGQRHWQVTDARLALEGVERRAQLAPDDRRRLAEATELQGRVVQLYQQGKVQQALPVAQKVLAIRKQVLGERDLDYATTLSDLASLYFAQGVYAKAEPLYCQARDTFKQVLGERHPDYATSLHNLAGLYYKQGDYAKAEPLCRQALEIRKEVLGAHHPDYAISLDNLAGLYKAQGEYAQAEPLCRQALEIRKQVLGPHHPDYADSLISLGNLYQAQGEYAQAEPLCRQALEIRKQVLGQRHPDYAISLNSLALLYQAQGEYAQAEPLLRQALEIKKQVLGERHPHYANSLISLAVLYAYQGKYAQAEPLLRQARDIYKQALGERHPLYALSLHNLAWLYLNQQEYAQAEPLFRQAQDLRKQVLGERHPDYAHSLNSLAFLYEAQGEYAKAEPLYRQTLEIRKQVLGQRHPDYAGTLDDLAFLYHAQGQYDQAEPLYRQALAALRQRPDALPLEFGQLTAGDLRPLPETVKALARYSVLMEQRLGPRPTIAQLRAADHGFALALALRERLRQEVLQEDASKLQHGAESLDLIPRHIGLCQRLFDRQSSEADLENAVATAEQGTARVFLEQLGKARALTVGRVSTELRTQEVALRRQLRELDARLAKEQDKPSDKRDPDKVGQLLEEQKKVEAQLTALIRRMEQDSPQYAALKYPRPCSLTQARACLAPTEVAVLFVPGNEKSYLLLVEGRPAPADKAHGLAIYPLPSRDDLADGISLLTDRDTLEKPSQARTAGQQTYDLLLAPVKDRLRGKDLVIVPGGPLAYVPFEALVEDGRFLIEKHRIRYTPSLTALHLVHLWEQTRAKPQRPLWAMADPVYDKTDQRVEGTKDLAHASAMVLAEYLSRAHRIRPAAGAPYPRLHFTGQEAAAIRDLLGASDKDVLTGLQASEAAVKAASAKGLLAQARYVHFATHGILGLDTGQPPALVLSLVGNDGKGDEEGGINDGFLRLDEVTRLQLNADLVVLSACETGKGRLYAGEGVTGLARAFLYAGSRGVVASLWAVDDRETASFMTHLYGGLKDGQSAADALRAAKLAMIRDHKPPVYWAPFILIGE